MKLAEHYFPAAERDYAEIVSDLVNKSVTAAARFRDALDRTVDMLCDYPELGEIFPYDPAGKIRYRTVADFSNYVIFYRSDETELHVVRVRHGNEDYGDMFF